MISKYVTDSVEALAAVKASGVTEVWINGSETFVTVDESVIEAPKPVAKKSKLVEAVKELSI